MFVFDLEWVLASKRVYVWWWFYHLHACIGYYITKQFQPCNSKYLRQWQIGALAVFLSWLNFIFILKYMPYTAVPINMFLSICVTFLKVIFLPIVLILAFGIPFYMVFVHTTSSSKVSCWYSPRLCPYFSCYTPLSIFSLNVHCFRRQVNACVIIIIFLYRR